MTQRHLAVRIREAAADTPVLILSGARQTGKSTMAQGLCREGLFQHYVTLDDAVTLAAAKNDPAGFLDGFSGPTVIDEAQHAPELFPAIKAAVDRNRKPGRFLLTGSANVLLLPAISESLAGRMEIFTLRPLSQGEIRGTKEGFLSMAFAEKAPKSREYPPERNLIGSALSGGFPEALERKDARRRAWFSAYVTAVLQRDIRDLAHIEGLTDLPRLLALLAARAASLINFSDVSRALAMPLTTLRRYLTLLETAYLTQFLPAWSGDLGRRLVKAPKLMLCDTGLLSHLVGLTPERLQSHPELSGPLVENFVFLEMQKQAGWDANPPSLFHFRSHTGQEVDLVLENSAGKLVGIEVKASATVDAKAFRGLQSLAEATKRRFHRGIVLYAGRQTLPFGSGMFAMPISSLWEAGA